MTLHALPLALIDYETTGPDPSECMPVQVCVAHWNLGVGEPVVILNERINPGIPIPDGASNVHGIYDKDVADCPTIEDLAPRIRAAVEGRTQLAFNAPFESKITSRLVAPVRCTDMLDPLVFVKKVDKYKTGKKLVDACSRRGWTFDAHDAMADTLAAGRLFEELLRQMSIEAGQGGEGWHKWPLEKFLARQAMLAVEQDRGYARWCAANGRDVPDMRWAAAVESGR